MFCAILSLALQPAIFTNLLLRRTNRRLIPLYVSTAMRYYPSVIKTFADRVTVALFVGKFVKKVDRKLAIKAAKKLQQLHAAESLSDLLVPAGNQLEKLTGELISYHSIRVDRQWRIIFIWENAHAYKVRFCDYH